MSQNIATLADKKELYDLSDLNIKIIENIIEAFNQIHGQRDYETGLIKVNEDLNKTTMRDELERMMANPELGLRQVVPLISMWVDEFNLAFHFPLYEMEKKRLAQKQQLADQIEQVSKLKRSVQFDFSISEILAVLEVEELSEAIPYLEIQTQEGGRLPEPPKTVEELIQRINALWSLSEKTISIKFSPDMFKNTDEPSSQKNTQKIQEKAKLWLQQMQAKTGYSMNEFFAEYDKQPPEFQKAISEAMDENIQKNMAQNSHYQMSLVTEKEKEQNFMQRLIRKVLYWFQTY